MGTRLRRGLRRFATPLYLGTITLINVTLGLIVAGALWAIGMPMPFVWGAAAAILNFLPYIGALFTIKLDGRRGTGIEPSLDARRSLWNRRYDEVYDRLPERVAGSSANAAEVSAGTALPEARERLIAPWERWGVSRSSRRAHGVPRAPAAVAWCRRRVVSDGGDRKAGAVAHPERVRPEVRLDEQRVPAVARDGWSTRCRAAAACAAAAGGRGVDRRCVRRARHGR